MKKRKIASSKKIKSVPVVLSKKEWKTLVKTLMTPPEPSEAFKQAFLGESETVKSSDQTNSKRSKKRKS